MYNIIDKIDLDDIIITERMFGGIFMNISDYRKNTDIKDTLIQMSDNISELNRLIENINVLTEEIHTSLFNQIDLKTEIEQFRFRHNPEVSAIKSGMIREFVIRANEKIDDLTNLSDKSVMLINNI